MKYKIDHDLHIHTKISYCSGDSEQTLERALEYARQNQLNKLCVANHFWDEDIECASSFYQPQNYSRLIKDKPNKDNNGIEFLFGCETEINSDKVLGITNDRFSSFDFVIIPTTHMHMQFTLKEEERDIKGRAKAWVDRLDILLNMDLPFRKIGLAHLVSKLINNKSIEDYIATLNLISSDDMERLFSKAGKLGVGIEINRGDFDFDSRYTDFILRPFRIAKECGCKFYLGSDAHHPNEFDDAVKYFARAIDLLALEEKDKFIIES